MSEQDRTSNENTPMIHRLRMKHQAEYEDGGMLTITVDDRMATFEIVANKGAAGTCVTIDRRSFLTAVAAFAREIETRVADDLGKVVDEDGFLVLGNTADEMLECPFYVAGAYPESVHDGENDAQTQMSEVMSLGSRGSVTRSWLDTDKPVELEEHPDL